MKAIVTLAAMLAATAAQAHESFAPHQHPHAMSWLPSTETVGVGALVIALAAIVITQMRRG
jgi:hypothetical protein